MNQTDSVPSALGLAHRWNRFWYAEGNPLSLGVFRALFAVCLALELPVTRSVSVFAIRGGFHLPYLPFVPLVAPDVYHLIHDLQYPFILLLGIGLLPRIAATVLLVLQGYVFFADQLNFRNHPYLFLLFLLLFAFAPSGKAFSISALARRTLGGLRGVGALAEPVVPLTVQRLMQVQISIVYFYAAIHKLTVQFLGGWVLADVVGGALATGPFGRHLAGLLSPESFQTFNQAAARPGFWVPAAWVTVILEMLLPFALWSPRWRRAAMAFGIPFHVAIGYTMRIEIFSLAMISSYLLFLDPATLPKLWARFGGPPDPPPKRPAKGRKARS